MTYVTPPATKKNALAATTTGDITTGAVTIPISDCSICYDKDGNRITIGYVLRNPNSLTTPPPEEIIITDCSVAYGTGGPGNLTGVTRAVNYDANTGGIPQGAAYAWPTGTVIAVMISTKVYNTLIGDIADLEANKAATNQKLDDFGTPDDNTDLDATTSHHGLVVKPVAPASGLINVVAIGNGETAFTNKPLLDSTNPEALGASAAPGSAVVSARRDHVHPKPSAGDIGAATTSNKIDDFAVPGTSDTTKDANTTNHGLLLKAVAPATGFIRFVGIAYGETIYALKELFAATTPSMDGSASAGTALTAARIDHVHPSDTSRLANSGAANGKIYVGKTDGTFTPVTLTQGANITITNADGAITIAAVGGGDFLINQIFS